MPPSAGPGPEARGGGQPPRSDSSAGEPLDVRQQRQLPRALDRRAELALMSGAGARETARQDLPALGQEPGQGALVLEVHDPDAGLTDGAGLRGSLHSSSSSSPVFAAVAGTGWAPSFTTTRWRRTPSSSFTARSNSGSAVASVSNLATA